MLEPKRHTFRHRSAVEVSKLLIAPLVPVFGWRKFGCVFSQYQRVARCSASLKRSASRVRIVISSFGAPPFRNCDVVRVLVEIDSLDPYDKTHRGSI